MNKWKMYAPVNFMSFVIMQEMTTKDLLPILSFSTPGEWENWLESHHKKSKGIWVQFYKKNSSVQSITYDQALDIALCYGWIDSQLKKYDELSYLQKFTPRRPGSVWSKRNTEHVARLLTDGKMKPSGLQLVEEAKQNGQWEKAYASPEKSTIPADFLEELKKDKKAFAFLQTLNKANVYAISWRLETAKKKETKEKRMKTILEMLSKGQKFHE